MHRVDHRARAAERSGPTAGWEARGWRGVAREVVLGAEQSVGEGQSIARALLAELGVAERALVGPA